MRYKQPNTMTKITSFTVRFQIVVNILIVIACCYILFETFVYHKRAPSMERWHYIHSFLAIALIISGILMIRDLSLSKSSRTSARPLRRVFSLLNIILGVFLIIVGSKVITTPEVPETRTIIFLIAGAMHIPYGIWIWSANNRSVY